MATATRKATTVFADLPCPHCGGMNNLSIQLENMNLECGECSETVTRAAVEALAARWTALLNWIDAAEKFATE